jgi:hypothetical protein
MNPNAIVLMIFGASSGYCMHGGLWGASLGLAITSGLVLLASFKR